MYLLGGLRNLKSTMGLRLQDRSLLASLSFLRVGFTRIGPGSLNGLLHLSSRWYYFKLLLVLPYDLIQLPVLPCRRLITVSLRVAQRSLLLLLGAQLHLTLILLQHYNIMLLRNFSFLLKPVFSWLIFNLILDRGQLLIQHLHRSIGPFALRSLFRWRLLLHQS